MVGRSRPSSGNHVFGPFAFSGFDVPATGQATIPFGKPITCGALLPDLSADRTTPGRPGASGHYLSKVPVFEG
jgi:hypothetical protein